jgi:hypothetical protein
LFLESSRFISRQRHFEEVRIIERVTRSKFKIIQLLKRLKLIVTEIRDEK